MAPGKQSADGRFTGPCEIAKRWTPYEISIVSVPADPTVGVGRDMENCDVANKGRMRDIYSRQLQINKNYMKSRNVLRLQTRSTYFCVFFCICSLTVIKNKKEKSINDVILFGRRYV